MEFDIILKQFPIQKIFDFSFNPVSILPLFIRLLIDDNCEPKQIESMIQFETLYESGSLDLLFFICFSGSREKQIIILEKICFRFHFYRLNFVQLPKAS